MSGLAFPRKGRVQPPDHTPRPGGPALPGEPDVHQEWTAAYDEMRWIALRAVGDLGAIALDNKHNTLGKLAEASHTKYLAEIDRLPGLREVWEARWSLEGTIR